MSTVHWCFLTGRELLLKDPIRHMFISPLTRHVSMRIFVQVVVAIDLLLDARQKSVTLGCTAPKFQMLLACHASL